MMRHSPLPTVTPAQAGAHPGRCESHHDVRGVIFHFPYADVWTGPRLRGDDGLGWVGTEFEREAWVGTLSEVQ
jgi:hypothetical protein